MKRHVSEYIQQDYMTGAYSLSSFDFRVNDEG